MAYLCSVCETKIELLKPKKGDRYTCPNCFAQLAFYDIKGNLYVGCAMCKESIFDPTNCGSCERRQSKKEILEEGRL